MNSPNQSDIVALQRGLKNRAPARNGLRLYTADFDSISLGGFYKGRSAFLVLSGPSLNDLDLTQLDRRGIVSMGVNNSWTVHRPTLWTCVDDPGRFIDTGWKDPGVLKFVPVCHWGRKLRIQASDGTMRDSAYRVAQMPSVLFFRRSNHFDHERFLTGDTVPWGNDPKSTDSLGIKGKRSVMLVALRLLHHLGFRTVYLLGCDFRMTVDHKYAFDETREAAAIRHNNVLYDSLSRRFEALLPHFEKHRFRVVNCSPGSGLSVFERMPYQNAIAAVSAECSKPINTQGWYTPVDAGREAAK
ncbi:MAG: hypothetical protein CMJ31_09150 [Phycisphaerae bacterium]|nr:hypothetical protein [Phycisphaerae bacterium]